jgi:hypothetical protein
MTVAEWVRQALRDARRGVSTVPVERKLLAVREAVAHSYPSGDRPRLRGRGRMIFVDSNIPMYLVGLHSYVATDRREAMQPAFDALLGIVDDIFPRSDHGAV